MDEDFDGVTMDACLIAAGQRASTEMAAYGTLVAWARGLRPQTWRICCRPRWMRKAADRNSRVGGSSIIRTPPTAQSRTTGEDDSQAAKPAVGAKSPNRTTEANR